jgi:hypothetical protein
MKLYRASSKIGCTLLNEKVVALQIKVIINIINLNLPSGLTLGIKEYLSPERKPAPPRPRKPDFFISSIIQS